MTANTIGLVVVDQLDFDLSKVASVLQRFFVASSTAVHPEPVVIKVHPGYAGTLNLDHVRDKLRAYAAKRPDSVVIGLSSVITRPQMAADWLLVDPAKSAAIFDFWWEEDEGSDVLRWVFDLFCVALALLSGRRCLDERCCLSAEVACSRELVASAQICAACKESLSRAELGMLVGAIEARLGWFRGKLDLTYSFEELGLLGTEELLGLNRIEEQVAINRETLAGWAKEHLDLPRRQLSSAAICQELAKRKIAGPLKLDSPRRAKLSKFVGKVTDLDPLFYLTRKRYRDHSDHVSQVALFGFFLLRASFSDGRSLTERASEGLRRRYAHSGANLDLDEQGLEAAWTLASLIHDTGYVLAHLLEVVTCLSTDKVAAKATTHLARTMLRQHKGVFASGWLALLDTASKAFGLDDAPTRIKIMLGAKLFDTLNEVATWESSRAIPAQRLLRKCLDQLRADPERHAFDHGLWSAANMVEVLGEMSVDCRQPAVESILCEALTAAAAHNLPLAKDFSIEFDSHPLSAILRFCDETQEWQRATWHGTGMAPECTGVTLGPTYQLGDRTFIGDPLLVQFRFAHSAALETTGWRSDLFFESKRPLVSGLTMPFRFRFETTMATQA